MSVNRGHKIKVLDKYTAELIAAGEVVERPSSVVKELLENSIDAGATAITIEIENGGVTLIRITDNGSGIEKEQVPTAFLRHATSKVSNANDLEKIGTLGFRGEALPSIATVARVEMVTCTASDKVATNYVIHGGEEVLNDDGAHPVGTSIFVRDLFYNVPARLKFLKKDVSEGNAVAKVVDFIALSNSHISIRFIRDGKQELNTTGGGQLDSTIYEVFGKEFSDSLVKVEYTLNGVSVSGFTSKPACGRGNRSLQMFFINGRYVKSATAAAALSQSYKGQVMTGKFPACVLQIELPFEMVDVNVHPAKIEVRFVDEKPIFSAVFYGVKSAITGSFSPSEMSLKPADKMDARKGGAGQAVQQKIDINRPFGNVSPVSVVDNARGGIVAKDTTSSTYSSEVTTTRGEMSPLSASTDNVQPAINVDGIAFKREGAGGLDTAFPMPLTRRGASIDVVFEDFEERKEKARDDIVGGNATHSSVNAIVDVDDAVGVVEFIGEIFETYILAQMGDSVYIIDKHAAHERIVLNNLKSGYYVAAQMLLSPVVVSLSRDEHTAIIEEIDNLGKAGFEVDDFGGSSIIVRAVPMLLEGGFVEDTIKEIASGLLDGRAEGDFSTAKLDWIFHSTACRAAVKSGDRSTGEELLSLAKLVLLGDDVKTCPHGRPVSYRLNRREIERQFGRIN